MATQADVRRIALSLPDTEEKPGHFAFSVRNRGKLKGFVWVWMERVHPKKPRIPQPKVLAVRVANLIDKDFLLAANPGKFFTEPHYDGFPAILVRLEQVTVRELRPLITDAWRTQAPKELQEREPKEGGARGSAGKKTEHAGPKRGRGAYYGRKALAKLSSNRARREEDKRIIRERR